MVLIGLSCTSLWTSKLIMIVFLSLRAHTCPPSQVYGFRVGDVFMWGPNSLAMLLGLVQLGLIYQYPPRKLSSILPLEVRKSPLSGGIDKK
jgi:hypothetical protein